MGDSIDAALEAAERGIPAVAATPGVIMPFPGGVAASGSKAGSRYKFCIASTYEVIALRCAKSWARPRSCRRAWIRSWRSSSTAAIWPTICQATQAAIRGFGRDARPGEDLGRQLRRPARQEFHLFASRAAARVSGRSVTAGSLPSCLLKILPWPNRRFDVQRLLREGSLSHVEHHPTLTSTNDRAREIALDLPADETALVIADEQTAGRGRGSNRWWTGAGSLAFSLVFDPAAQGIKRQHYPLISLATARGDRRRGAAEHSARAARLALAERRFRGRKKAGRHPDRGPAQRQACAGHRLERQQSHRGRARPSCASGPRRWPT